MAGPATYSLRAVAERSLCDLVQMHQRLTRDAASIGIRPAYVFDARSYLAPTPRHVNRQALAQLIVNREAKGPEWLTHIYDVVLDDELLNDLYAIAWSDAQEQALNAVSSVCEHRIPLGPVRPSFDDGVLKLSREERVAFYVDTQLREAGEAIRCSDGSEDKLPWRQLLRASETMSTVEQAFKVAAASLLTFDMEETLAGLMCTEVLAACA